MIHRASSAVLPTTFQRWAWCTYRWAYLQVRTGSIGETLAPRVKWYIPSTYCVTGLSAYIEV